MSRRISATGHGHRPPTGPAFDIVLLLHVAAVVVGLGAVVTSGIQAARLLSVSGDGRRAQAAELPASLREYFAPGVNWVGRTLYAVPVLGFVLLGMSHGAYGVNDAWVQGGLVLWVAATVVAEWLHWPVERRIQSLLAGEPTAPTAPTDDPPTDDPPTAPAPPTDDPPTAPAPPTADRRSELRRACRSLCVTSAGLAGILVAAIVLMVSRP